MRGQTRSAAQVTVFLIFCIGFTLGFFSPMYFGFDKEGKSESVPKLPESHYTSSTGFLYSKSPLHLMHLAKFDAFMFSKFKQYQTKLKRRMKRLKTYIADFERNLVNAERKEVNDLENWQWAFQASSNPARAYPLLARMTSNLPKLLQDIESGLETDLMEEIYQKKDQNSLDWPSEHDPEVTRQALIELPIVYDIPVTSICNGSFLGDTPALKADHCNQIASTAYNTNKLASGVQWLDAARKRKKVEKPKTVPDEILNMNYATLCAEHDFELANVTATKVSESRPLTSLWEDDLYPHNVSFGIDDVESPRLRHLHISQTPQDRIHPTVRFRQLCAGANFQSSKELSQGHCFHSKVTDPLTSLLPLKVEVLNRFPPVIQIHDFVDSSTSLALITQAMTSIETQNGPGQGQKAKGEELTASPPIPATLTTDGVQALARFGPITKLWKELTQIPTAKVTERLHVNAYSFANFDSSLDSFPDSDFTESQVQQTLNIHIFLNSIGGGGRTVFPKLGFGVDPTRNSALIWSQFKMNGVGHPNLYWINCPVIAGNKWVASNYIRQESKEFGSSSGNIFAKLK